MIAPFLRSLIKNRIEIKVASDDVIIFFTSACSSSSTTCIEVRTPIVTRSELDGAILSVCARIGDKTLSSIRPYVSYLGIGPIYIYIKTNTKSFCQIDLPYFSYLGT